MLGVVRARLDVCECVMRTPEEAVRWGDKALELSVQAAV